MTVHSFGLRRNGNGGISGVVSISHEGMMMSANMTVAPGAAPSAAARPAFAGLAVLRELYDRVRRRRALRREIGRLADTDARLLRDAGIDPDWAAEEIDKPFWQA